MQTAGAVTVAAVTETPANAIAANTIIAFANITRARRDTRIGARRAVPRRYMALASHSGSYEQDCSGQVQPTEV